MRLLREDSQLCWLFGSWSERVADQGTPSSVAFVFTSSPVEVSAVKQSFLTPGNGLTPSEARIQRTERLKLSSTEPLTATSAPLCRLFIIQSKGATVEISTGCY